MNRPSEQARQSKITVARARPIRLHTIIVVDDTGRPIRVSCDYCDSQHNFRGGPRVESGAPSSSTTSAGSGAPPRAHPPPALVGDRERTGMPVSASDPNQENLEVLLRRIIREEIGLAPVAPAAKWRGGTLVLRPSTPGLQEKSWPIETFFHKIVMLRNRLRTLEQQVNASDLPDDVKLKLQGYISGCYGSLTSFNVLFADEADQFKGSGGD